MNKRLVFIALFFMAFAVFAEEPPMTGWEWDFGSTVTLNGKRFIWSQYAESWREQDGYALVSGIRLHYWLYNTYAYHNGDGSVIYDRIIPKWVEDMGYVIDYDHIRKVNPNTSLASSVKALMTQRGCDISVSLVTDRTFGPNDYVIINEYSSSKNIYWSTIYPLYK